MTSRRGSIAIAAAALVLAGCGADRPMPPPAPWPDPSALPSAVVAPSASASSVPPPRPFPLADALARVHEVAPIAPSQHLGGEYEARVLANDLAGSYPKLGAAQTLSAGALVVEALSRPGAAATLYFIMQKGEPVAGGAPVWEYIVVEANGATDARGESLLCARCHAEAPRDHLFGRSR